MNLKYNMKKMKKMKRIHKKSKELCLTNQFILSKKYSLMKRVKIKKKKKKEILKNLVFFFLEIIN